MVGRSDAPVPRARGFPDRVPRVYRGDRISDPWRRPRVSVLGPARLPGFPAAHRIRDMDVVRIHVDSTVVRQRAIRMSDTIDYTAPSWWHGIGPDVHVEHYRVVFRGPEVLIEYRVRFLRDVIRIRARRGRAHDPWFDGAWARWKPERDVWIRRDDPGDFT